MGWTRGLPWKWWTSQEELSQVERLSESMGELLVLLGLPALPNHYASLEGVRLLVSGVTRGVNECTPVQNHLSQFYLCQNAVP